MYVFWILQSKEYKAEYRTVKQYLQQVHIDNVYYVIPWFPPLYYCLLYNNVIGI